MLVLLVIVLKHNYKLKSQNLYLLGQKSHSSAPKLHTIILLELIYHGGQQIYEIKLNWSLINTKTTFQLFSLHNQQIFMLSKTMNIYF